jgi:serine/threonine protein kinase
LRQSKGGKNKKVWIVITSSMVFFTNSALAHQTGQSLFFYAWHVVKDATNQLINSFIHEEEKFDRSAHRHRVKDETDDFHQSGPQKGKAEDPKREADPDLDPAILDQVDGWRSGFALHDDHDDFMWADPVLSDVPLFVIDELDEPLEEETPSTVVETVEVGPTPTRPALTVVQKPKKLPQVSKPDETNNRPDDKPAEPAKKPRKTRKERPEKVYSQQEILLQQKTRREHFFGEKQFIDLSGAALDTSELELLGKGVFGQVCGFEHDGESFIIKVPIADKGRDDMQTERSISESLGLAFETQLGTTFRQELEESSGDFERLDFTKLQGLDGVATVIGVGPNGSIIQKWIKGGNLQSMIENPEEGSLYSGPQSFPRNLQQTKFMFLQLASELLAIHTLGKVHCDIKSNNLMVDEDGNIHIIDLGSMIDQGEHIRAFYHNGAPEVTAQKPSPTKERLKEVQQDIVKLENKNVRPERPKKSTNPMFARMWNGKYALYKKKLAEYDANKIERDRQLLELKNEVSSLQQQLEEEKPKIMPSYDVYTEGSVLPGLLFGGPGLEFSKKKFYGNSVEYLEETQDLDYIQRTSYFEEHYTDLNDRLQLATSDSYSDEVIKQLAELQAWMMMPEPTERPTSEQIFAQAAELNDISTAEEENTKLGEKERAEESLDEEETLMEQEAQG